VLFRGKDKYLYNILYITITKSKSIKVSY